MKSLKDRLQKKALPTTGQQFSIERGTIVSMADNTATYIRDAYNVNDIIYSIINLILDKVRIPQWGVYQIEDKSSLKLYYSYLSKKDLSAKDCSRIIDLRHKALTPVKSPGKWGELLKYPNEYQTFQDFITQGCGYKLLTGNKYIWANIIEFGANKGSPQELWLMPSQYMQLLIKGGFPSMVAGYRISSMVHQARTFQINEVLHEKYNSFDWGVNGEQHYGISPLKAALRLTNRNNSALESSTAKFQNGGLEAIVYVDDPNLSNDVRHAQAAQTKKSLITEYTGSDKWGKITASPFKMGVANLGLSPVELDIIQAEKWDLRRFCNIYGVPSQLLNDPDNKVYNNTKEGEKALTTRCALPLLTSLRDNLNRKGHTDWNLDKNIVVDFDITCFSELQADVKEVAQWTSSLIAISPNEQRELVGLATVNDPAMDEVWVKKNDRTPLSDYGMNIVDNAISGDNTQV